jgi:hypothetical protein
MIVSSASLFVLVVVVPPVVIVVDSRPHGGNHNRFLSSFLSSAKPLSMFISQPTTLTNTDIGNEALSLPDILKGRAIHCNGEATVIPSYLHFCWNFVPVVTGSKAFKMGLLKHRRSFSKVVTVANEAFALLALENSLDNWADKAKGLPPGDQRRRKYSSSKQEDGRPQGWSEEGRCRLDELLDRVVQDRRVNNSLFDLAVGKKVDEQGSGGKKRGHRTVDDRGAAKKYRGSFFDEDDASDCMFETNFNAGSFGGGTSGGIGRCS